MEYAFTCKCKCLFGGYIRDGERAVRNCPLCKEPVHDAIPMRPEQAARSSLTLIPDITPFKSVVDGSVVGSRRTLADHNKRNDVVQVGTDKWGTRQEAAPMQRAGHDIKRALETARSN